MNLEQLKYPIGKYEKPLPVTAEHLKSYIHDISTFPVRLHKAVAHLSDGQLDTPYREGGWTVRQVVHHCADSHMNGLARIKLALTEDNPTIKPYFEDRWAALPDSKKMPIEVSLKMLEGIHDHWAYLLKSLTKNQWQRSFIHPEHDKEIRLDENTGMYAWHSNHHLAHITSLNARMGWK